MEWPAPHWSVRFTEVPGIADGIFREPDVQELASKLRGLLEGVDGGTGTL
jgi:hypothetical protein